MKNWVVSISVFVLSFAVTAFVGFYIAMFLIGPHSDILPELLHVPVGFLLLTIIVGLPALLARNIFKRINKKQNT